MWLLSKDILPFWNRFFSFSRSTIDQNSNFSAAFSAISPMLSCPKCALFFLLIIYPVSSIWIRLTRHPAFCSRCLWSGRFHSSSSYSRILIVWWKIVADSWLWSFDHRGLFASLSHTWMFCGMLSRKGAHYFCKFSSLFSHTRSS